MMREERLRFIEEELRGLWPQWDPTEAELRVWMGVLGDYEYGVSRTALQQCFCGPAGHYGRPRPVGFLERVKALRGPTRPSVALRADEMAPRIYLECIEAPPDKPHRLGKRKPLFVPPAAWRHGEDGILACAQATAAAFDHLYGGHWIPVRPAHVAESARDT